MKLSKLSDIFDIKYGHGLELNRLKITSDGVNFVSRTAKNNGVSAKVEVQEESIVYPAGTLTVALGGSVLETFLQPENYVTGFHVFCLTPKTQLTLEQKLYYCQCIRANKYRYNYGRQANRTLKDILIPSIESIPKWICSANVNEFDGADKPVNEASPISINTSDWVAFRYDKLFDIRKGKRLTKANMVPGDTPYIGSSDSNNGLTSMIGQKAIHQGNVISLSYNGSVGEAFYQPKPFWATDDVNVLYPIGFELNSAIALFLCALIRKEKYRFNYGRKWHTERMNESVIRLPVDKKGNPNWGFMASYIQSLPYSSQI